MPRNPIDEGHVEADTILAETEKEVSKIYAQASDEMRKKAMDYMLWFYDLDRKKKIQVEEGTLDEDTYKQWRISHLLTGKRWKDMSEVLANDMTNANQIAASVINGHLPEVYAVNANYATYTIEKQAKIDTSFTLYDRLTVERLLRDKPDLIPMKANVNVPKDLRWNKQQLNAQVLQGILQGEDIPTIADRLGKNIPEMNRVSAVRNARTMTTSAENGGRIDSYKRAEGMGISLKQRWVATLDGRTRHEHRQLDGQMQSVGNPFVVDGYEIDFPGDPKAEPFLIYNCRCTLIGVVDGSETDKYFSDEYGERNSKLGDMSYEEWKENHRNEGN